MKMLPLLDLVRRHVGPLQAVRRGQQLGLPFGITQADGTLQCHAFEFATHLGDIVELAALHAGHAEAALVLLDQQTVSRQAIERLT